ncbi:bacteriohopanetetrol glucosamine biosynthesis glycosyltransferase HpnI [Caballeronia sp.]|uniref:bacteriohopanetetrol glucosamine biosynthesis glycosyltransferase HpnI n=1 Tax=Caballeronia sp. TaxID=1931223 RepID=UPI003C6F6805
MRITLECIAWLCGAGAVLGSLYMLVASQLTRRFLGRGSAMPVSYPAVTIIKPLFGTEHALLNNLSGFCTQDYPGPIQYLFGVHDKNDAALEVVESLRRLQPGASISVVADARLYGPNRKMSNIMNMLPHVKHDILIFADSDVGVSPDYVRCVVGELQQPGVGLVTCLYRGVPDPGFWPRLSANSSNYHFLPGVVVGMALGLASPCFGQTIALRRATLDEIGGFGQFTHHLAEDHAIGAAVRKLGQKVVVARMLVTHACDETSVTQLVAHELRWSRTIRTIDPLGYFGSVLTHPLALALLAIAFSGASSWSLPLVFVALCARLALKLQLDRVLGQAPRDLWLVPLWDLASFAIFVSSFLSKRIIWRGYPFNVGHDGLLYPLGDTDTGAQSVYASTLVPNAAPPATEISLGPN